MNNGIEDHYIHNIIAELDIVIDRPVSQVWRQWLDMGSWVTSHDIQEISDAKRTEGAISRLSFKRAAELGMPLPHQHFVKVLQAIPEQRIILKAYSGEGGSYGMQMIGFDEVRFETVDGKTRVIFRGYSECRGEIVKTEALKSVESDNHMQRNLENLKRIVESQPRGKM